ncbi:hypothetical protein [Bacillus smithii]|uniref:hypothetical protein n=1 Tax=Bacillus smithii TaxID=1479 RepID=UPI003D230907
MKKVSDVWTFVYKEKGSSPKAFSYKSHKDALEVKTMFEENNGTELFDEHGDVVGYFELEWCYLIEGKLIESVDNQKNAPSIKINKPQSIDFDDVIKQLADIGIKVSFDHKKGEWSMIAGKLNFKNNK